MNMIIKRLLPAAVVLGALLRAATTLEAAEPVSLENLVAPEPNRADEPLAERFSMGQAARFLDSASLEWQRSRQCFTCHTNISYLIARPAIDAAAPAHRQVRNHAEELISQRWEEAGPRSDAEVVAIAAALALNDAATTKTLHPLTRRALDRVWTVERPEGDWKWPTRCGWPPMESDEHYGVTLAAIATGAAPDGYAQTSAAQAGLARIRNYLKNHPPTGLHQKAMVLWAATYVDGLMTAQERKACIKELLDAERPTGGWAFSTLYPWTQADGKEQDLVTSDGYGTGFVVFVLRQAGVPADAAAIARGVAWLKSHQRATGRWFTRSLNKDNLHFISHAGTAFAVMALAACGETSTALGEDAGPAIAWKKTVIEGKFRSEGVAIADVNRDGQRDILIGDSWYEAPAWTKHDIRKPGDYGDGLRSYSECMTCWQDDVNGDGWVDQLVIGFPGKPAYWYENPRDRPGYWTEHAIWPSACNETPLYVDLFGDGRRVLVMGWQPKGKDNEGQMAWFTPGSDPAQAWEMHPISEPSQPGKVIPGTFRFAHGLGVGDLNGDGRSDVICTGGWWEQPAGGRQSPGAWPFHPAQLGDAVADMIVTDVNHDGKPDVIASSAHKFGIWWFEQGAVRDGSPVFNRHDLFPDLVSETHALIAADINRDGLDDLVTGKRFWSHGRAEPGSDKPARLYWLEARRGPDGMLAFTPREIDDQSGIGTQFVVADFNGDGLLDIVTANKKGVFLVEQVKSANSSGSLP